MKDEASSERLDPAEGRGAGTAATQGKADLRRLGSGKSSAGWGPKT
ncbi:MAG: hypothetical protein M1132_12000 [Chloroflexi bacterium]|nr:hypothetical protein [Chloroflexota bacterium]